MAVAAVLEMKVTEVALCLMVHCDALAEVVKEVVVVVGEEWFRFVLVG